jgi:hypothetical protein
MAMTEQEWLACENEWLTSSDAMPLLQMVEFLHRAGERKLRLFGVACCRNIWSLLRDERSRNAVQVAEQFADGLVQPQTLRVVWESACAVSDTAAGLVSVAAACAASNAASWNGRTAMGYAADDASTAAAESVSTKAAAKLQQVGFLRDIFGNPFHPVTIHPAWRTSNVTALAQSIYDDRAFDRLPILADALEDAGCDNADILNHCRQPGEHVRGCWVVDLVLGKE